MGFANWGFAELPELKPLFPCAANVAPKGATYKSRLSVCFGAFADVAREA